MCKKEEPLTRNQHNKIKSTYKGIKDLSLKNLPCQQYLHALKDLYQVIFGNAHLKICQNPNWSSKNLAQVADWITNPSAKTNLWAETVEAYVCTTYQLMSKRATHLVSLAGIWAWSSVQAIDKTLTYLPQADNIRYMLWITTSFITWWLSLNIP
jgi:hypothetical protein